jgi:hypothetical protein
MSNTLKFVGILCICLLSAAALGAKEKPKKTGTAVAEIPAAEVFDEISDNAGHITKAKVLGIGEKEILIKDPVTGEDKKLATENLIFVRTATGKYYFFFQPEPPPSQNSSAKASPSTGREFEITAGMAGHFANNDTVGNYTSEYAASLVTRYNQQVGSGFSATSSGGAPALHWQFFAEPRLNYENFILGLSLGYAGLPKTSAVVSSAGQSVQSTINVNGQFFPVAFMFYYRLINDGPLGLNLGFGAGVLYSALRVSIVGGPAENEQILTSLNPMLVFKPELTYKFGAVRFLISMPVYWAEARDVTDGEETLIQVSSRNIVSPKLTGVGVMLAAGIRL